MRRYRVFLGAFRGGVHAATLAFGVVLPSNVAEAYTYHLATDPSLSHMLSALRNGAPTLSMHPEPTCLALLALSLPWSRARRSVASSSAYSDAGRSRCGR